MGAATGSQTSSKVTKKLPSRIGAGYRDNLARLGFKDRELCRAAKDRKQLLNKFLDLRQPLIPTPYPLIHQVQLCYSVRDSSRFRYKTQRALEHM